MSVKHYVIVSGCWRTSQESWRKKPNLLTATIHNDIVVYMLPGFDDSGNLPPGIHDASWAEFVARFGGNHHRQRLVAGMERALAILRSAGCKRVYVDGSFVTSKPTPGDYDLAWEPGGVDVALLLSLDPVFGVFDNGRAAQKAKYQGEFFPSSFTEALTGRTFLDFFQTDKDTGDPKGIVALDL